MYYKFFNLTRKPFEISIDPRFYYPTAQHNEAMAMLSYGVQMKKGFLVLTGEVGTGKTLLVRCLLDFLIRSKIAFAYIYNPALSVKDFLGHVLADFGLPPVARSKGEMLFQLNRYLMARPGSADTSVLVVDEAQLLGERLLEEIRLLTNLETSEHKLLQIVLVGQPELDLKLDSHDLRQLKQRIGLRCRLEPLGREDVYGYIRKRLSLAGADAHASTIFPDETVEVIYQISKGLPRLINILCENALISGFARQALQISPEIIRETAKDLRLEMPMSTTDIEALENTAANVSGIAIQTAPCSVDVEGPMLSN